MTGFVALASDFARALDPTQIARDVGIEQLDAWQAQLLDDPPKRVLMLCGRQVGKSTTASLVALNAAVYQAPALVILVSPSQRQSIELYRTLHSIWQRLPGAPKAEFETLTRLELDNGSRILSLPGSEKTVRGYAAADLVVVDEAARVEDDLMSAVRPMLAVSDGKLFALTTPAGKRGWFFEQWTKGIGWHRVMIKSTDCPRIDPAFLEEERQALGPLIFGQEYLCEFHEAEGAAFLADLLEKVFTTEVKPFVPMPRSS
jgi:hypothetical protein